MKPLRADDPASIGGYRLLGTLGAGGMGRVYLARSTGGRTVALKVIRGEYADDPMFRRRFRREVDAARRVSGPWTAQVIDADPDGSQPFLVTTYVPGPSLLEAVADRGPLPPITVRALGAGLAEALIAIHRAGLVHRDLKPSNVLLALEGPRVIDFGIARAVDATVLTRSGAAIGSPAFMAPEQVNGAEATAATDVFALGTVLIFAATGVSPFEAPTVPAVMNAVLNRDPDLDGLPTELRSLVGACLRKDPAERPSPEAVRAALAPDGASALVAYDWLPPDLVVSLSRRATALLDLDAPPPASGVGTATAAAGAAGMTAGSTPGAGTTALAGTPVPEAPRAPTTPPPGPPGGWPSRPGAGPRHGRGLVVALAAGGAAVVVVILVVVVLLVMRPGGNGDGAEAFAGTTTAGPTAEPDGPTPPSSGSGAATGGHEPTGAADEVRQGALPEGYVGTWVGQVTSQAGTVQDAVVTLKAGRSGETLGHTEYTSSTLSALTDEPVTCRGDQRFTGLTGTGGDETVVLDDIPGAEENPTLLGVAVCTDGGRTLLHLEADGRMSLMVDDPAAGQPTGLLNRKP